MKYDLIKNVPQVVQKAVRAIWDEVPDRKPINLNAVVYTFGDTCYTNNSPLPKHLVKHEEVHMRQQEAIGGPVIWWERYAKDPQFRYEQELEAYRVQYQYVKQTENRQIAFATAKRCAEILSSPLYGNVSNFNNALRDIMA